MWGFLFLNTRGKEVYVFFHIVWGDCILWGCTCGKFVHSTGYVPCETRGAQRVEASASPRSV